MCFALPFVAVFREALLFFFEVLTFRKHNDTHAKCPLLDTKTRLRKNGARCLVILSLCSSSNRLASALTHAQQTDCSAEDFRTTRPSY